MLRKDDVPSQFASGKIQFHFDHATFQKRGKTTKIVGKNVIVSLATLVIKTSPGAALMFV